MDKYSNQAELYYRDTFFEHPWQELEQQLQFNFNTSNSAIDFQTVMAHYSDAFFEDPWKDLLESSGNLNSSPSFQSSKPQNFNKRGKSHFQHRGRGRGKSRGNF